jgi:hypothetical protein
VICAKLLNQSNIIQFKAHNAMVCDEHLMAFSTLPTIRNFLFDRSPDYAPPTRILLTGMCTAKRVQLVGCQRKKDELWEALTELDDISNNPHSDEPNTNSLGDLDEFPSVS